MPLFNRLTLALLLTTSSVSALAQGTGADDKKRWDEFVKLTEPHSHALWQLENMDGDKPIGSHIDSAANGARDMLATKTLRDACTTYANVPAPSGATPYRVPKRACDLIARADALTLSFVELSTKKYADERISRLNSIVKGVTEGHAEEGAFNDIALLSESRANIAGKIAKVYEAIERKPPEELLKPIDDIPAAFDAAVQAQVSATKLPDTKAADRALDKVVRDHFSKSKLAKHKYTVRRTWVDAGDWTVVRGAVNPVRREKLGHTLVQVEGESFCRLYRVTYAQAYVGAGKFQSAGEVVPQPNLQVAKCK